jgi:tetratricopeptide (TPR) repeat protein
VLSVSSVTKNIMRAIPFILLLLLFSCSPGPERLLEEAREQWHQKEYREAALCYERFLQQPKGMRHLEGRLELANTYYLNLRNYNRAEFHYRMLLIEAGSAPENADKALLAHRRLAELTVKSGRLTQAIGEYEELFARVPESEQRELRIEIANLYYETNNLDQAELEYLKVVDGVPYDTFSEEAYLRVAGIRHRFRQQYKTAAPIYEIIRSNTVKESIMRTASYGLAECYAADAQYTAAIQVLKQIQKVLSGDEVLQVRRLIKEYKKRREQIAKLPQVDWSNPPH